MEMWFPPFLVSLPPPWSSPHFPSVCWLIAFPVLDDMGKQKRSVCFCSPGPRPPKAEGEVSSGYGWCRTRVALAQVGISVFQKEGKIVSRYNHKTYLGNVLKAETRSVSHRIQLLYPSQPETASRCQEKGVIRLS